MSTHKNSAPYTASDIEKYRKGELSAREMHDLERAALDDPFLADAIEGLIRHTPTQEDLIDLHQRLDAKLTRQTRRNRVIIIRRRIAVAAALILLLGIGYTFFYHHTDSLDKASAIAGAPQPATVARNTPAPAARPFQSETKAKADSTASHFTPPANIRVTAALRHRHRETAAKHAGYLSSEARSVASAPAHQMAVIDSQSAARASYLAKASPDDKQRSVAAIQADSRSFDYFTAKNIHPNPIVLSGKVLDLQNHPLAGAFLALHGNSGFGTTTDEQGQFRISFHPRDSTRQLTVSMIGYDHASLSINALSPDDHQNNIIRLKPHSSDLDEVVVIGYGTHRKETEVIAPSDDSDEKLDTLWINATPVIGRPAYLQYLDGTKTKLGLDSTITGTETLSFIVSRDGSLSSFKIEQSLSPAHDAGIMRLVADGPAWRLIRGKKVRASVTINF